LAIGSGLSAPEPLGAAHDVGGFDCGIASLDDWLRRRALANQASGASRSFVVVGQDRVVAYYALAAGAVTVAAATGRIRRNMPDPIPVAVLGRLAVDRAWHGQGLGRALVRDAAQRIVRAAGELGIRAVLVHAISAEAKAFYERVGFDPSPLDPMTLMIGLADLIAALMPNA
jgi:GNAT superfamily N-acetyltransferase